ncbi:DCC1-like thiol-disulfide oxidoreductase family protein [Sinorhizobium sp. BG8]|uniref:thiol-disulfide oxidoreductase DCC family protein n=1 Tax=Sinorhizobium sp. BG8 TaxID=2613773 RepID=UPI00193D5D07|nr:DCC1-like thiol-disulfide oxidoreductase family protein [Sinorhizobium sp. BG8]QRM55247.1 DUF393 domain-containing protein [Sinorhizobium sp. BG8]
MQKYSYRSDPTVPHFPDDRPVIVFDGQCVFCSGWVRFALNADSRGRYRFLTTQSATGAALYRHYGLDSHDHETSMLIEDGRAYLRSEGSIRMIAGLGFPWTLVRILSAIPRRVADRAYEFVARNRFRIAGRRDACFVPSPQQRARFIG